MKKEMVKFIIIFIGVFVACILSINIDKIYDRVKFPNQLKVYDPNDEIYKYIPPADKTWTDKFGDNERTRLIHSISELRVVVNNHGSILRAMMDPNEVDPNE